MALLGWLSGIAAGVGAGFAVARYLLPPTKKAIVARLGALLRQLPVDVVIRRRSDDRTIFANDYGAQQGMRNADKSGQANPGSPELEAERVVTLAANGQPARKLELTQAPVDWPAEGEAVAHVSTDITRHKLAEAQALARVEAECKIFDAASVLLMVLDEEGRVVRQNAVCFKLFGPLPDAPSPLLWERTEAEDAPRLELSFQNTLRSGAQSSGITQMRGLRDSAGVWIAWTLDALRQDPGAAAVNRGERSRILFTGTDETSNVRTAQERAGIERTLEAVWQNAPEALALVNSEGLIVSVNSAFLELCGLPEGEVHDHLLFSILRRPDGPPDEARERFRSEFEQRNLSRQVQEFDVGGVSKWLEFSWGLVDNVQGLPLALLSVSNLTERILAERE